jgi:ribonuclease J
MVKPIKPTADEVLYVPLGGAGEIGMNMYVYGHAGKWLLIDAGISFAHDGIPGVELLMPDPDFIMEHADDVVGLVVTHAHEDHIGAIAYVIEELGCPIYATQFTAAMIRTKLDEFELSRKIKIHIVEANDPIDVGPFGISYLPLTHSIPDNHGLVITTKIGKIFHTGDWKFDPNPGLGRPSDLAALRALGQESVLAMMCDSTNVFEPGHSGSEVEVTKSLTKIIAGLSGRVAVTMFASNVARLHSVIQAAIAADRQVVLAGRSLHRVYEIATKLGYIEDSPHVVDEDQAGYFPDDKVLFICTGCQGERRSALAKIAAGEHRHIELGKGDHVIFSSREIPGNEIAIQQLQNSLARQGVNLITAHSHFTHVSGHPYRDELSEMYRLVRPKVAVPMHGELRHLQAHVELAKEMQVGTALVAQNGQMLRLTKQGASYVDEIDTGVLALDGGQWISLKSELLKERQKFTWNGAIAISAAIDQKGRLQDGTQVSLIGVMEQDQHDETIAEIESQIAKTISGLSKAELRDDKVLADKIRIAAQRVVQAASGKKPIGRVHIVRV